LAPTAGVLPPCLPRAIGASTRGKTRQRKRMSSSRSPQRMPGCRLLRGSGDGRAKPPWIPTGPLTTPAALTPPSRLQRTTPRLSRMTQLPSPGLAATAVRSSRAASAAGTDRQLTKAGARPSGLHPARHSLLGRFPCTSVPLTSSTGARLMNPMQPARAHSDARPPGTAGLLRDIYPPCTSSTPWTAAEVPIPRKRR
jgi:hypothetical protein